MDAYYISLDVLNYIIQGSSYRFVPVYRLNVGLVRIEMYQHTVCRYDGAYRWHGKMIENIFKFF